MHRKQWFLLLVLALVLLLGIGLAYSVFILQPRQQLFDLLDTQRAGAGQTAVFESDLTRIAHP